MPLLEPLFQKLRVNQVASHIKLNGIIVDIGCDDPPVLLQKFSSKMKYCIGIDEAVSYKKNGNIEVFHQSIDRQIKLESNVANTITMLAVLEHLKNPQDILNECYRILKKDGILLITVPPPQSKPVLELLSTLKLVRSEMINQHENYFSHEVLRKLLLTSGFENIIIKNFELGFNTLIKANKVK